MESLHTKFVGDYHVVELAPRLLASRPVYVEHEIPTGVLHEERPHSGSNVHLVNQTVRPRSDHERCVAGCMAGRRHRGDAGDQLFGSLILRHLAIECAQYALDVGELAFDRLLETRRIRIVGPELNVGGRHQYFRIREGNFVFRVKQAANVVAVQVRDDDDVHCILVDSRSSEIVMELT